MHAHLRFYAHYYYLGRTSWSGTVLTQILPLQIIEGEIQKQTAEAGKELWDVVEEGRRKVALRGAHKILGDTEKSRKKLTGVKSVSPRGERVVTVGRNTEMARGRGITVMDRQADIDALKDPRILAEEAEMNEAGRRERVQEEYIMQLQVRSSSKPFLCT